MAELPAPSEGFVLTHFIVSADVPRSAAQENRRSSSSPRAEAAATGDFALWLGGGS